MKKHLLFAFFLILTAPWLHAQEDEAECKKVEPAYLNRMAGFYIANCEYSEFNEKKFEYEPVDGKTNYLTKAGVYRRIKYDKKETETRTISGAQIRMNYASAVKQIKGKSWSHYNDFFSFTNNGKEIFLKILYADDDSDNGYVVEIIEVEAMQQEIAITLQKALETDGKAALYGILFDVNKATIKPESQPALQEIIDYLKAHPTVKIYIVGHTDNTGMYASNMTLSQERAKSVREYLINTGKIDAARLLAEGVGPLCPVTTNATPEGKQKNRRVEIVIQ